MKFFLLNMGLNWLLGTGRLRGELLGVSVLAILALTVFWTTNPRVIAFAVTLQTVRLLTITTFLGQLTITGSSLLDSLLCGSNYVFAARHIFAVDTGAVVSTLFASRETFTVHFEAECFFACAADFTFFAGVGSCLDMRDAFSEWIVFWWDRWEFHVFERTMVGEHIIGVDEFKSEGSIR